MQTLYTILFLFAFGATSGWLGEFVGRSIRAKKLVNPGFLSGPALPIYGFGVVLLHFLSNLNTAFLGNRILEIVFFTAVVVAVMTLLELIGGIIFIKGMKLKLWDYSNQWGNFMGIVCPSFSAMWGACGLLYYFLVNPWLARWTEYVANSMPLLLLLGFYYGVMAVDFAFSMKLGLKLRAVVEKFKNTVNIQELQKDWRARFGQQNKKAFFSLHFKLNSLLNDIFENKGEKPIYKYLYDKYSKINGGKNEDKKDD
ncbi:MAG: putative ABC transporter permease [Clostridia bacterium]|nr:putative ABC transporter permease [Clostridia bacterium]